MMDDVRHLSPRQIMITRVNDTSPIQVSTLTSFYEPLQYVLLFPDGTAGWDEELRKQYKLTQMLYYRYTLCVRLQIQPNRNPPAVYNVNMNLPRSYASIIDNRCHWTSTNRLFNEYLVDMYSRMVDE